MSSSGSTLGLGNIKAPRNGYVLIYVSNSSEQFVYFDNLQVGKVNGNILEENHYYSFGLRISAISSRRFTDSYQGKAANAYLYQGAFAELDDDIGWQDFALRSYDAQIGKFIQSDPFGQFAGPYAGMGNDPINLIDPSGGIGIPCPGTSAASIFFSNVGETLSNLAGSISSIPSWVGIAERTAQIASNVYLYVTQFNIVSQMISVNLTRSVGDGNSGSNQSSRNSNNCNCPEGYSSTPPNSNSTPLFKDPDDVAKYWAWKMRKTAMEKANAVEYSSMIYTIEVKSRNGMVTLYGATAPKPFPNGEGFEPWKESPGFGSKYHEKLPTGATPFGHIHLHWLGSDGYADHSGNGNTTFSSRDNANHQQISHATYYVLGSKGGLYARYGDLPDKGGWFDDRARTKPKLPIDSGYYSNQKTQPSLCPCYKK